MKMKISPRFGPREPRFGRDLKSRFGVSRREILGYVKTADARMPSRMPDVDHGGSGMARQKRPLFERVVTYFKISDFGPFGAEERRDVPRHETQ